MTISYINTDLVLVLVSPHDLTPLAAALEIMGISHIDLRKEKDGYWYATLETLTNHAEPEAALTEMLDVIETLSAEVYNLWSICAKREFNIGYQCGSKPFSFHQTVTNSTLSRIANVNSEITITLYGSAIARRTPPAKTLI